MSTPQHSEAEPRLEKCKVYLSDRVNVRGRTRLWAFGVPDLAAVGGCSEQVVHSAIHEGVLNPFDLESVLWWWYKRARSSDYRRSWQDSAVLQAQARKVKQLKDLEKQMTKWVTEKGNTRTLKNVDGYVDRRAANRRKSK